ncbi:MAG: hypothetical protein IT423_22300, partial [Pirellulaceae bacterium]|nr:hypothetical protein [Pirellulaceae bacterium]
MPASASDSNRRRFLGSIAATAAGTACLTHPYLSPLNAAAPVQSGQSAIRETEHFWCRLAPAGPYIDSQRDNQAFGFGDGRIFLSEDNAQTWAHSTAFPDADNITFSCLLKNGNILFATREKIFLSTDKLKSYRQIIVKNRDGSDYLPHTPQNPDQPGWYFHPLDGIHTWEIDGREMLVWGNYCNVLGGPVPINIYYSTDSGQTIKIAYSFGRNPKFQE